MAYGRRCAVAGPTVQRTGSRSFPIASASSVSRAVVVVRHAKRCSDTEIPLAKRCSDTEIPLRNSPDTEIPLEHFGLHLECLLHLVQQSRTARRILDKVARGKDVPINAAGADVLIDNLIVKNE